MQISQVSILSNLGEEAAITLYLCFPQAKDRIQYYQLDEVFVFPYDLGSKWKNFKQVFTWSGVPEGDGLEWPTRKDCHPYSLTVSSFVQKAVLFSGFINPLNFLRLPSHIVVSVSSVCQNEPNVKWLHKLFQYNKYSGIRNWDKDLKYPRKAES